MTTEDTRIAEQPEHVEMPLEDLFLLRLQLLIVMGKAFLKGYPLGKFRKQAILENSESVFYMSLHLSHCEPPNAVEETEDSKKTVSGDTPAKRLLHQRIQLMAIMAKAIAEDRLIGDSKRKALVENINAICASVTFKGPFREADFLKVA